MLQFKNGSFVSAVTYDNTVVVADQQFNLSDAETLKVYDLIQSLISSRSTTAPKEQKNPTTKASSKKATETTKPSTKASTTEAKASSSKKGQFDRDLYESCARELGVLTKDGKVLKANRQKVYDLMATKQGK